MGATSRVTTVARPGYNSAAGFRAGGAARYVRRAVRGGSWNNNQALARCAARNGNNANNRNDNIGFRVCCASHIFPVLFMARRSRVPLRAHRDRKDRGRFRKCSPTTVCGPRLEEERWRGRVPSARIASRGHAVGRISNRGASRAKSPEAPRLLKW